MEQRLSCITLGVADLARSRRFYEDGLGWQPRYVDEHIALYQLNGLAFALFANPDATLPPGRSGAGAVMLSYLVQSRAEVDALMERAVSAGAVVISPARDMSWGEYAGFFADPDGHPWEVGWNPDWSLDEAGNITIPACVVRQAQQ